MKQGIKNVLSTLYRIHMGVVFFITLLIFYLPIRFFLTTEQKKQAIFPVFVAWARLFCLFTGLRIAIKNTFEIKEKQVIFIANHTSFLDIIYMYLLFPKHPFLFLGKAELLKVPLVKTFFKKLHIPVFREAKTKTGQSFKQASEALKNGWSIIIFPEGGIKEKYVPELQPFKEGAFKLAALHQVPLVPISFLNNYELFADPSTKNAVARPGKAHVMVHDCIYINTNDENTINIKKQEAFDVINQGLKN
jgi:1-acyl-sn-glycerol-3-phosphate acyltransferase